MKSHIDSNFDQHATDLFSTNLSKHGSGMNGNKKSNIDTVNHHIQKQKNQTAKAKADKKRKKAKIIKKTSKYKLKNNAHFMILYTTWIKGFQVKIIK